MSCLLAITLLAQLAAGFYHEAWCPSVDPRSMTRMKRNVAIAMGLLPAPDCHPELRVRYLGISGAENSPNPPRRIHVDAYDKKDGTHVKEHLRSAPNERITPTPSESPADSSPPI